MSQKTYNLINAIITGLETITIGIVTYFELPDLVLINTSVVIGLNAIKEICKTWIKEND